jgi:hypothetical protein
MIAQGVSKTPHPAGNNEMGHGRVRKAFARQLKEANE